MRSAFLAAGLICAPAVSAACDVALLLALDTSGSVDAREYDIQRGGLATALRDGSVAEALVRSSAHVAVLQWTGSSRQKVTIPWTKIATFEDVEHLAGLIERDARVWKNFSTAIGEALHVAHDVFEAGPECRRRILDVSGDGTSNEGISPRKVHPVLRQDGIVVNGLVIEGSEEDLTGYFWENVISGEGAFVVTANTFEDYPRRIREKLLREIVPRYSDSGPVGRQPARFVITAE